MARQRGTTWQADVVLKSGNRLRPGGFQTREAAELWEAQTRVNDAQGLKPPPVSTQRRSLAAQLDVHLTIGDLRKRVLNTPARDGWRGSKDFNNVSIRSQQVVTFFGADKPARDIDLDALDLFINAMVEVGDSPATINRKLATLSKMLNFAAQRAILTNVPRIPRQQEYEGRIRFLTRDEERGWLAALALAGQHQVRAFLVFLIDTGARVSEALALTHADWGASATFWITKGGKARTVPLTARAKAACELGRRHSDKGPFSNLTYWMVRDAAWKARGVAGLAEDVILHTARHTCCSRLVMAGSDIRRVQKWMGHQSIQTTLRYAHLAPDALGDMAALLEEAPVMHRS